MTRRKAINLLKEKVSFSEVLKHYDLGNVSELVVNRYGDICTYRVNMKGEIYER